MGRIGLAPVRGDTRRSRSSRRARGHAARSWLPGSRSPCSSSGGSSSISFCSCREAPLADNQPNPLQPALADGIVPEEEVTRSENRWVVIMLGMLGVMMAVIVATGVTNALNPPSNVEFVDPTTLHLGGEFAESNLGTAAEPDGSVTVRLIAEQYFFVINCAQGPVSSRL